MAVTASSPRATRACHSQISGATPWPPQIAGQEHPGQPRQAADDDDRGQEPHDLAAPLDSGNAAPVAEADAKQEAGQVAHVAVLRRPRPHPERPFTQDRTGGAPEYRHATGQEDGDLEHPTFHDRHLQ